MFNFNTTQTPHVNGAQPETLQNGHISPLHDHTPTQTSTNGVIHGRVSESDIELQLLALMKHHRGVIQRVCRQTKPVLRTDFNDEAAGCIFGACATATAELGIATAADVLRTLEAWTREDNDNAPPAIEALAFWPALDECLPEVAPDDAPTLAIELAAKVKARGRDGSIPQAATAASIAKPRFSLLTSLQVKERRAPEYLVAGLLVKNSLAAIVGPSGTFKTFVALGIAGAVGTGKPWHRREVNRASVVYVSGEGSGGLRARIMAWEQHYGQEMNDCHFLTQAVQMLDRKDVDAFIEAVQQLPEAPGLIVFDTLARCIVGGDENSAKDMGEFVAAADRVRIETGATVLIVHHTGKSGDTRGSTALPGAMDTIINIDRHGDFVEVKCGKQKDAEEFATISFARRIVEMPDGATSLILEPSEEAYVALRRGTAKSEEVRNRVLDALRQAPEGLRAGEWGEAVENAGVCKQRSFYSHRDELQAAGKVAKTNGVYRIKEVETASTATTARTANAVQMQQMPNGSEVLQKVLQKPTLLEGGCSTCSTDECSDESEVTI